jgi:hypothetical protein
MEGPEPGSKRNLGVISAEMGNRNRGDSREMDGHRTGMTLVDDKRDVAILVKIILEIEGFGVRVLSRLVGGE